MCLGLTALDRPRFFAGQLLTEADLGAAQEYVRSKSRLHNRYLHGPGVVCGLQVSCDECTGWASVKPGYAIDPCGEDVVVAEEQHIDVISAIRDCRAAHRRPVDCDPVRPDTSRACAEESDHWCITLAYEEYETRPVNTLRAGAASTPKAGCSCGGGDCGCGGGGGSGCGCGGHAHGNGNGNGAETARPAASAGQLPVECEPTRVHEGFRISVVPAPPELCRDNVTAMLQNETAIGSVIRCFKQVASVMQESVPRKSALVLARMLTVTSNSASPGSLQDQHDAYLSFRRAVRTLMVDNPNAVRCAELDLWKDAYVDPPRDGITEKQYAEQARAEMFTLGALLLQYAIDCACAAAMPQCSANPVDARLTLACVEVRDDKILQICNFPCRRQAGSFPALYYWLPLPAILALVLGGICCRPSIVRRRSPLVNDLLDFVDRVDPSGTVRDALAEEDFVMPRSYARRASDAVTRVRKRMTAEGIARSVPADAVNLSAFVSEPASEVRTKMKKAGVTPVERELAEGEEPPALANLAAPPLAARGSQVVMYTRAGKVVGYAREAPEVTALRDEVSKLRGQVDELRYEREG